MKVISQECPKCGQPMTRGAPHAEGDVYQWECRCGHIIQISSEDTSPRQVIPNDRSETRVREGGRRRFPPSCAHPSF